MPTSAVSATAAVIATMPQSIWRANQMAVGRSSVIPTGFSNLDEELPGGGGWPRNSLIELLLLHHGIGEMQLLKPALVEQSKIRRIALVQPPHLPNGPACHAWGLRPDYLLWIKPANTADALWATEHILKNRSCGAVILWQSHIRPEALRRLNLAAQGSDVCFWLLRPMSARQDTSPPPFRLALTPT